MEIKILSSCTNISTRPK